MKYIFMQKGRTREALQILKTVVEKAEDRQESSEWTFRLAIAQFAEGEKDDSLKNLKLAIEEKKYKPSHELYLVNQYIQGDFRDSLEALLSTKDPSPPRTGCPTPGKSG